MSTNTSVVFVAALSMGSIISPVWAAEASTKPMAVEVSEALKAISVKTTLVEKLGTDALGIMVTVSGETATLSGAVSKPASQGLAEQVALSVEGITKVDNQVTRSVPLGTAETTKDSMKNALLDLKVKSALLSQVGTNALKIEVESVDGVVSLRGQPDSADTAREAIRTARSVKGVRKVVNLLNS